MLPLIPIAIVALGGTAFWATRKPKGEMTPERALNQLGAFAAGSVQDYITHGKFEPNAPSTLARKYPKTHPLENTGQLKQGISFVVEPKEAR